MKAKEVKQREAEQRNAQWREKSPKEQLIHLDRLRLRAKKQRKKISEQIKDDN